MKDVDVQEYDDSFFNFNSDIARSNPRNQQRDSFIKKSESSARMNQNRAKDNLNQT